jgi:tetratricopeptide (TPR) repeat protein
LKLYGPEHGWTSNAHEFLGSVYMRLGKFDQAEGCFNQALKIREVVFGPDSPEVAYVLNSMSINSINQGQYSRAVGLLKRVLSIYDTVPDSADMFEPGFAHINLGIVYYSLGELPEAELCINRGIDIFGHDSVAMDYGIATGLLNLGMVYEAQGRFAEADSILRLAVSMGEEALGPYEPLFGHALNNLANLSSRLGRHAEAESLQVRAISILEGSLGPEHPEVAKFRRDMGRIYAYSGKSKQSLAAYNKFIDHSQRFLENVFPYSSEEQKLRWIDKYPLVDHTLFSLAMHADDVSSRKLALEMLLKSKAMVIEAVMAEKQAAYCHYDD